MSETPALTAARTPTVYFIDDSATMREVIKIAFRKENINVITCADAASALAQFGDSAPDVVITDVIMPDKDGYEVCQFIKEHERFGKTPVILMSGVVNRTVAEKAMQVKADELVRKPFQPQDLIARVKSLLNPAGTPQRGSLREEEANSSQAASRVLGGLFAPLSGLQNGAPPNAATANFAPLLSARLNCVLKLPPPKLICNFKAGQASRSCSARRKPGISVPSPTSTRYTSGRSRKAARPCFSNSITIRSCPIAQPMPGVLAPPSCSTRPS